MKIPNFVAENMVTVLKELVDELEDVQDLCPSYDKAKRVLDDVEFWSQVGSYYKGG